MPQKTVANARRIPGVFLEAFCSTWQYELQSLSTFESSLEDATLYAFT